MAADISANQQAWQSELDQQGKVNVSSTFGSLLWRVGIAIALVAFFVYVRYENGDIGQRGLTLAIVGFAMLIAACIAFVLKQYGGKSITIDRSGITLIDGVFLPWNDVSSVGVYAPAKAAPSVAINLTQSAWDAHMGKQNAAAKVMHKANKLVVRDRALVMPSYLAAEPTELAAWLNRFAAEAPST